MNHDSRRTSGTGCAPAHHGEILQGIFCDASGPRRTLVTLRCPAYESRATFYPCAGRAEITVPPGMWKVHNAPVAAMTTFARKHSPVIGGSLCIASTVPCGIGIGSSTADVTAIVRAIADFHGIAPSAEEIARVAVQAELASDPLIIDDRVVLFAHRDGVVLETLGRQLPPMIVVGCEADPCSDGVDTVTLTPAAYSLTEIETFGHLLAELRTAIARADVARLGSVATASATVKQRFLAKPAFDFLLDACQHYGGCGVQVAHSGTVAGIVFDPLQPRLARCMDRIADTGLRLTGVIDTIGSPVPMPQRGSPY
jgi:uncharacterized protein involved in propanediol utilization